MSPHGKESRPYAAFERTAKWYDNLYADKHYENECDFIERRFRLYSGRGRKSIIDLGCGTGGHAIPLAKRGYQVTGIDSSREMISVAKKKAANFKLNIDFRVMDLRRLSLGRSFDAAICMFSVTNYFMTDKDLNNFLSRVRDHLSQGGLYIFDFWNGEAVVKVRPEIRTKEVTFPSGRIIRTAKPELNLTKHLCTVRYHVLVLNGDRCLDEFWETHKVRYFYPSEISRCARRNNLELLEMEPFTKTSKRTADNWHTIAVCRAD